jgi:hypothetical protein
MAKSLIFETDTTDFGELFANGAMFRVPRFQRDYSWTEEQWGDLWDDLVRAWKDPNYRHYLGALVLQKEGDREWTVIDGQQRLATLTIVVIAVIRVLTAIAEPTKGENDERVGILKRRFLGEKNPTSLTYSSKLFLNRRNNEIFQDYLVQLRDFPTPRSLPAGSRLLVEAVDYFVKRIRSNGEISRSGKTLAEFVDRTISLQLLFIQITVSDQLSAFTLFETLNARGLELTATDLIRNYLFAQVRSELDLDRLEREWDRVVSTVTDEKFPDYARHFFGMSMGQVRRERLFRIVRDKVTDASGTFHLVGEFHKYAELYVALSDPNHELWQDNQEAQKHVRTLSLLSVRQVYPILFAAHERFESKDFVRLLRSVATLSLRYSVAGRNPRELEPVYNAAAKKIQNGVLKRPGAVFQEIRSVYPSDHQFQEALGIFARPSSGQSKKLVRYLLYSLEEGSGGVMADFELDPGTIEHILPENPGDEWSKAFPPKEQGGYIYRLGNLTLLERDLNRQVANKGFSSKKKIYHKSRFQITKAIESEEWTPATVAARQAQMASTAVKVWRSDFDK